MPLIKLVVVEDEIWMREALRTAFDWTSLGVCLAGEASDGQQALALIETERPEIVLLDIRMPLMNGLELLKQINTRSIETNVIIISAYRDFEYAQEAVKLGAFDYVVKPIFEDQLIDVIQRCLERLTIKQEKMYEFENMTGSYKESLPLARQKFIENVLGDDHHELPDRTEEKLKKLGIPIDPNMLGIMSIVVYDWGNKGEDKKSRSMLRSTIGTIATEAIRETYDAIACTAGDEDNDVVVLFSPLTEGDKARDRPMIAEKCDEMIEKISQMVDVDVSVGYSRYGMLSNAKDGLKEAANSAAMAFFEGNGKSYHLPSAFPAACGHIAIFPHKGWEQSLLLALKMKDLDAVDRLCDELIQHVNQLRGPFPPLSIMQSFRISFQRLFDQWMDSLQPEEDSISYYYKIKETWESSKRTLGNIKSFLLDSLRLTSEERHVQQAHKKLIQTAVAYINEKFKDDVTLNDVSDHLYISPWYLSKLFHERIGITFSKYVVSLKINEAKQLLAQTNMRIYEVAEEVGYSNFRHFAKTFKSVEGVTPSQYRNQIC